MLMHEESIEYNKFGLRDNVAQICVFKVQVVIDTKWTLILETLQISIYPMLFDVIIS